MGVRAAENQSDGNPLFAVEIQELQGRYAERLEHIAGQWEQGVRALIGLVGVTGLVGAPLATNRLDGPARIMVGVLLTLVLVTAITGLLAVMAAAYGSTTLHQPRSFAELDRNLRSQADRGRVRLIWGRRLAATALGLFALTVCVAWLIPSTKAASNFEVTSRGGHTDCGALLEAPEGSLAVQTDAHALVQVPIADVAKVRQVESCKNDES